jgi:polyhydroxyalkanoate synthesis regulator phasin
VGASCWTYFVPYQSNIEQALQELRQSVFEAGDYYQPSKFQERVARELFAAGQLTQEQLELQLEQIAARARPEPKTLDELIEQRFEEMTATHSIIDIEHVSDEADDFHTVSLLSAEQHEDVLGTVRPTRALLEEDEMQLALFELIDRGCAYYLIVYADDQPHELFFVGVTGD